MDCRLLFLAAAGFPAWASAADFDGSRVLLCATVEAYDCGAADTCAKNTPRELGAPSFMRIDFAKKVIVGTTRTTPIRHMEKTPEQLLLQGTEAGHGWTIALNPQNGEITAALNDRDEVFVLFGSCTPL